MAAPTPVARGSISGVRLDNGYQSFIAFSLDPTLEIWEKSVQRPNTDGGDPIPTDTMHNQVYMTKAPQCLFSHGEAVVVAAYDPGAGSGIDFMVNINQTISILYPEGSSYTFFGYVRLIEYAPLVKGTQPEVTITVVETDQDPLHCVEAGPVFVVGAGSCNPCHVFS